MVPLVLILVRMAAGGEGPAPTRRGWSPSPPAPILCWMLPLSAAVTARPAQIRVLRLFWTTEARCWCWNRPVL